MELRILIEAQEGASYADQLAAAQLAEELGFGGFFRTDHFLPLGLGPRTDTIPPTDAWTTIAGLARETSRIQLGTLVTAATFRRPGPLAVEVSQAAEMSGGRVELGIGAGWYEAEHRVYGIPYPGVRTRFDRLDETLQILTRYWAGEPFDFTGRHFELTNCPGDPRAVPIIVGGKGKPRGLRLAAHYAGEFNLEFPRPGVAARVRDGIVAACQAIGRDPDSLRYSAAHLACVGADEADLKIRADRAGLDLSLDLGGLIGTVEHVRERLDNLAAQGIERFYLQVPDLRDDAHFRLLAKLL
jgi:F420-dependent oxidoreductase-like protein